MIASLLFTWLQGADFYSSLHQQAVEHLPLGDGKIWIDVGCGPGLVSRLAAVRGYQVTGIDADPRMIRAAERLNKKWGLSALFKVGTLAELPKISADVVSAASLLAVMDDRLEALFSLWGCVRPGGYLLLIEPTAKMTLVNANRLINSGLPKKRIQGLRLWAAARQNRAVDPGIYRQLHAYQTHRLELLGGLVDAWIFQKPD